MYKKEFVAVFQLSKLIVFNVNYYTVGNNQHPYFATSADEFMSNKKDFTTGGQAQKILLAEYKTAMEFYEKYDKYHLLNLSDDVYNEIIKDLEKLKYKYNYLYEEFDEGAKYYNPYFSFYEVAEFTKQEPKK